jgi:hypothetical protein
MGRRHAVAYDRGQGVEGERRKGQQKGRQEHRGHAVRMIADQLTAA